MSWITAEFFEYHIHNFIIKVLHPFSTKFCAGTKNLIRGSFDPQAGSFLRLRISSRVLTPEKSLPDNSLPADLMYSSRVILSSSQPGNDQRHNSMQHFIKKPA